MECSIIFWILTKSFDSGIGIPKLKFIGRDTVWLQGKESRKERDGILYKQKYWRALNLVICLQIGHSKILVEFKFGGGPNLACK